MVFVSVTELRRNVRYFLRRAERGTVFVITKRGKPVAVLESYAAYRRQLEQLRGNSAT